MKFRHIIVSITLFLTSHCFAQTDSTNITGTWVDMSDKSRNRFIFTNDGYAISVVRGDSSGGSPEKNRGRYLRYEVKKSTKYYTLDLAGGKITNGKKEDSQTVKGIFIYLADGRIKLCLNLDPRQARPATFIKKNTVILTKQE